MRILTVYFLLLMIFFSLPGKADEPEPFLIFPVIPDEGETIKSFIPSGWSIVDSSSGLLDKDELTDLALIIQMDDSSLLEIVLSEDTMSESYRPRILLILSRTAENGYVKSCQSNQAILSEDDGEIPSDPLYDIEISNRILSISFRGVSAVKWGLSYQFHFHTDGYYLMKAISDGKGESESYKYDFNLLSGELNVEIYDEKVPSENLKYSKIKVVKGQPRLESFLPMSYIVDEKEGIIF